MFLRLRLKPDEDYSFSVRKRGLPAQIPVLSVPFGRAAPTCRATAVLQNCRQSLPPDFPADIPVLRAERAE